MDSLDNQLNYDRNHIWHPYTSAINPLPVFMVKEAHGCEITLDDGRVLIDGMSSWWAAIHGYNNLKLNKAAYEQLGKMAHIMFGGFTHEPAVNLAKKLIDLTPDDLQHVFYSDSGSVAVEVAMKMSLQYWQSKGQTQKTAFATVRKGYHGDTWNAMSVCDSEAGMHTLFHASLPKQYHVAEPKIGFHEDWDCSDLEEMKNLLENSSQVIAAVIIEPIVQGAGGMRFYHPEYLRQLRKLCDANDVLLICDEIATGFGRTGKLFAIEHSQICPDIMCLGKALTGGYISFAATLTTKKIAEGISSSAPYVFMHGPTYMGNPLACSIALQSIDILLSTDWYSRICEINEIMCNELSVATEYVNVSDVRVLGAIGVIELKKEVDMAKMQSDFVDEGVWIRPFGKLVYIMPPYIIEKQQLTKLCRAMLLVVCKH